MFHKSQKSFTLLNPEKQKFRLRRNCLTGVTLVELLVVIALISLVATIIVVALGGARAKARDAKRRAELDQIRKALVSYYIAEDKYPTTTDWISLEDTTNAEAQKVRNVLKPDYLSEIPEDPLWPQTYGTSTYSYRYIATSTDGSSYKLYAKREAGGYLEVASENPTIAYSSTLPESGGEGGGGGNGGTTCDIYIHDCAVLDQAGKTYCLDQDIIDSASSECINITADDIIFDGQGHTIDGNNTANTQGIFAENVFGIKTKNAVFTDWDVGIYYGNLKNSSIQNTTSTSNNYAGVLLGDVSNSTFSYINTDSNYVGIDIVAASSTLNSFSDITSNSNSLDGIVLRNGPSSNTFSSIITNLNSDVGIMASTSTSNNTFSGIVANSNGSAGVWLTYSANNNTLSNIDVESNGTPGNIGYGVVLDDSSNGNQLTQAIIKNHSTNDYSTGIWVGLNCSNNSISNVTSTENVNGVYFYFPFTNDFSGNIVDSNQYGIIIQTGISETYAITINNSKVRNNSDYGIYISSAYTNKIYNNIFKNATNTNSMSHANEWNVVKQLGDNIYDPSNPYIGGNYWTNLSATGYSDTCTDSDADGFCDNPYSINASNVDNLPLSNKYTP